MQTMRWTVASNVLPAQAGVPLICALAIAGATLYSLVAPVPQTPELDVFDGRRAVIEGTVVLDPDIREQTVRLTIRPEKISGGVIYHATSKIIVSVDRFTDVAYGDRISANGILKKPESFETDNGRTFDYPKYLRAEGISYEMSFANVKVLRSGEGNRVIAALLFVKHALIRGIERALPEPEAALAAGLLLGEKQSLGDAITEAFRRAGVVHIIVLSGYNVSIVIVAILFIAQRFFPRVAALSVAGLGIVLFALMTGASETTIRASVMALIVLLAKGLNRPADALRILLITAAGMALWNPFLVLYNLSYQLSILATLGLILFSDPIAKRLRFIPETFALRQIVAATIATQATVAPLLILSVGQFSVVSILANPLVLPAVEFAMLFSFLAASLSLISSVIAFPFSLAAYAFLRYIIEVSVWFGNLPFASVPISPSWMWFSLAFLATCYAALFWVFFKRKTP